MKSTKKYKRLKLMHPRAGFARRNSQLRTAGRAGAGNKPPARVVHAFRREVCSGLFLSPTPPGKTGDGLHIGIYYIPHPFPTLAGSIGGGKEGGRTFQNMRQKNNKAPAIALVKDGRLRCPNCGARLGDAYYGAYAHGIELWCGSKYCRMPVRIEIKQNTLP